MTSNPARADILALAVPSKHCQVQCLQWVTGSGLVPCCLQLALIPG